MNLAELIENCRDGLPYRQLAARGRRGITAQQIFQLAQDPPPPLSERAVFGLASALRVPERLVIASWSESIGVRMERISDVVQPGIGALTEIQQLTLARFIEEFKRDE